MTTNPTGIHDSRTCNEGIADCPECNGRGCIKCLNGKVPAPCEMCAHADAYEQRQAEVQQEVAKAVTDANFNHFKQTLAAEAKNVPERPQTSGIAISTPLRSLSEIQREWYDMVLDHKVSLPIALRVNQLLMEANLSGMHEANGLK